MRPQIWIIAGPNGSGKSTLADRYIVGKIPVVNPDNILRANPTLGMLAAGREAISQQESLLDSGQSFGWETTLTGHRELRFMEEARKTGYKVNLVFVAVQGAKMSMLRVATRVQAGGHHVSAADVMRRYQRSLNNLPGALALADRAYVFDNSGDCRRLLMSYEQGQPRRIARDLPMWFAQALPGVVLPTKRPKP